MTVRNDYTVKVVLYILDGCQVKALDELDTPEARILRDRALIYNDATTIYPSLTGPGHASIITGLKPSGHGLISHMYWDWSSGIKNIYSDAAFQQPTLFELLVKQGIHAQGHGNYFRRGISDPPTKRMLKWLANRVEGNTSISNLMEHMPSLEKFVKHRVAGTLNGLDQKIVDSKDNLHYVVDNRVDKSSHKYGPSSTEYQKSLETAMSDVVQLLNTFQSRREDYAVIVSSDHGHMGVENKINAESLDLTEVGLPLKEAKVLNANLVVTYGRERVTAVSVVVSRHLQVYLEDKTKVNRVREALAAKTFVDRVLTGDQVAEWGVANSRTGDILAGFKEHVGFAELPIGERGDHGGFTEDEMRVPLWILGSKVTPGLKRGGRTIDIVPTVYKLLGAKMNGERFHGEPLGL